MEIGSAFSEAAQGLQRSQSEMAGSAQEIARANVGNQVGSPEAASQPAASQQVAEPLIELQAQQQVFDANARVLETADENTGRLIDTLA